MAVLFFFPRGGSAQVARAFAGALPAAGWQVTLAAGSLGRRGGETKAGGFFSGLDVDPGDYSSAFDLVDSLAALLPFLASYEDWARAPAGWRYAAGWAERLRGWAQQCELVVVPPGAEAEAALLLGLERGRLRSLPGGVDLARFSRRPLAQTDRFCFWRRWLVDEPLGWDMSGRTGSVAYTEQDLAPFQAGAPVLVYVGRFTAVKRLPLLIPAPARANQRLGTPPPPVPVRRHPREWEGEHPPAPAPRPG